MATTSQQNALESLSIEHRQVLKLCDNIRKGLSNKIDNHRIRRYTDWFKENFLDRHFALEEQHIFPLLGNNVRVKKAKANHRRINKLLSCECGDERVLNLLEEELSTYIRFEERILLKEIREHATPEELSRIENLHDEIVISEEDWEDKFWNP